MLMPSLKFLLCHLFSSFLTFLQYTISAFAIWIAPRCSGKRWFRLSVSVCFAAENTCSQGTVINKFENVKTYNITDIVHSAYLASRCDKVLDVRLFVVGSSTTSK